MTIIYTTLLLLVTVLTLPWWLWRFLTTDKYREAPEERFGRLPETMVRDLAENPSLWLHAVSVGEVMAAAGLAQALKESFPELRLIVSTVTRTGRQVAKEQIPAADHVFFLPLDLPWITEKVVAAVNPRLMVVMETELWPNLFAAVGRRKIPLIVANGRLSPNSFKGYHRARFFMRGFLEPVTLFAMQSQGNADRMGRILGVSDRVRVTGNIKYDQALKLPGPADLLKLNHRIGPPIDEKTLLAASTHPGEEEILLNVFTRLREEDPELRLILVPRHPHRADEVAALAAKAGHGLLRLSQGKGAWEEPALLVDEVGWLMRLYGRATVVYVGGSLIPHGGQNLLEPAAWGLPALFGPHMFNFKEIVVQALDADAGIQIQDENELTDQARRLLADEETRTAMGARALAVVQANAGALERTLNAIREAVS